MERKVYIIENLDCANCAAKIEAKFNALPEVQEATITFATKQLRITAENPDSLIEKLTQTGGYDKSRVLMIGDAPGDLRAAEKNGVFFYPILVKGEGESWSEFISEGLPRLTEGRFGGEYQDKKRYAFLKNLGE